MYFRKGKKKTRKENEVYGWVPSLTCSVVVHGWVVAGGGGSLLSLDMNLVIIHYPLCSLVFLDLF